MKNTRWWLIGLVAIVCFVTPVAFQVYLTAAERNAEEAAHQKWLKSMVPAAEQYEKNRREQLDWQLKRDEAFTSQMEKLHRESKKP